VTTGVDVFSSGALTICEVGPAGALAGGAGATAAGSALTLGAADCVTVVAGDDTGGGVATGAVAVGGNGGVANGLVLVGAVINCSVMAKLPAIKRTDKPDKIAARPSMSYLSSAFSASRQVNCPYMV
jgi:hypothetical protein